MTVRIQFDKAVAAFVLEQNEDVCGEEFEQILERLQGLSSSARGQQALSLAAQLLELAAFDLADRVGSKDAGALIEAAALLTQRVLTELPAAQEPILPKGIH